MTDPAILDFERDLKELSYALETDKDHASLKKSFSALHEQLNDIAPQLPPYDRKRFYSSMDNLLKSISAKASTAGEGTKRFQFQKKLSLRKQAPSSVSESSQRVRKTTATIVGEVITIEGVTPSYENLDRCTLQVRSDTEPQQNGSLTLSNVNNGSVKLEPVPFSNGSIFITDCENLLVKCIVPPKNAVQIRLRNLRNCKLFILPAEMTSKQVVVLENCYSCVFHKTTENLLNLQNFNALALNDPGQDEDRGTRAFTFGHFDLSSALITDLE